MVTTKEMFDKANKHGYSIGAFNVDNMDGLQAIVDAAAAENSPVILAFTAKTLTYMRPQFIMNIIQACTQQTNVPIAVHLDHGKDFAICKEAIDAGFTSVMIDASSYPIEQNIAITKQVVDYAHPKGVVVEGEIGSISGIEDDVIVEDGYGKFTHPQEAVRLVTETGIDSLAIAIGTAHGAFKFKPGTDINLRFDIADEIHALLPNTPLVLHGASSVPVEHVKLYNQYGGALDEARGVPESMLTQAAKHGIAKINVGSDIRICYLGTIRKQLAENAKIIDIRDVVTPGRTAVTNMIRTRMNVFGSNGRADD